MRKIMVFIWMAFVGCAVQKSDSDGQDSLLRTVDSVLAAQRKLDSIKERIAYQRGLNDATDTCLKRLKEMMNE